MKFKKKYISIFIFILFLLLCLFRQAQLITEIDQWFYVLAQKLSYLEWWLKFWYLPTVLGDGRFVYTGTTLLGIYLMIRHRNIKIIGFVFFLMVLFLSNSVLKAFFSLERPVGLAPFYEELSTYTFPSGHAVNSVILFYFLPQMIQKIRIDFSWRPILFAFGILLISLSRVFLGVHWFFDVVGGVLWGFVISDLGLFIYEKIPGDHL